MSLIFITNINCQIFGIIYNYYYIRKMEINLTVWRYIYIYINKMLCVNGGQMYL